MFKKQNSSLESPPLVSIVTVNYNHSDVTCEMLDSLTRISYPNIEVIVVDNGSPDDNPQVIKDRFPDVNLIEIKENLGFAGGNNIGILATKGKYILLLNNDTIAPVDFLEPLVKKMEDDPTIGAVSPKIVSHYAPDSIHFAGLTEINPVTQRNKGIGFLEKDTKQYDVDAITAYAHGAAMMVSREVIKKIGLMATSYFLYYEELDWSYRIRQAGFKIFYVHNSLMLHKESVSIGKLSPLRTYFINRSRLLYMRRNVIGINLLFGIIYQIIISVPKNLLTFFIRGDFLSFHAYRKAVGWHIKNIFNKEIHHNPDFPDNSV